MAKTFAQLFTISTTAFTGFLFMLAVTPVLASSDCGNLKGCDRKFCEIENQLNIAQEQGNDRQADGLKKALDKASLNCTDEGLRAELLEDLKEANENLAEYQADLKEAEEDGGMDDVRKYQEKIEEERNEINKLEDGLSRLD